MHMVINLDEEPHWPDLGDRLDSVIHLGNDAKPIQIASLPGGMASGNASICLRLDLPDGTTVLAETSLALFLAAAQAFAAKYPQESGGPLTSEVERALQAAHMALRSYQYGNSSEELAKEVADHIAHVLRGYEKPA